MVINCSAFIFGLHVLYNRPPSSTQTYEATPLHPEEASCRDRFPKISGVPHSNDAVCIWNVVMDVIGNMRPCHLLAQEPRSPHARGSLQSSFSHGVLPLLRRASIHRMYFPPVDQLPNLPPVSLGKTRLPLSHPDHHCLHHPLLQAMPTSRLIFRWQPQTKVACPS